MFLSTDHSPSDTDVEMGLLRIDCSPLGVSDARNNEDLTHPLNQLSGRSPREGLEEMSSLVKSEEDTPST